MTDIWSLRQHNEEVDECAEEGCTRPVYEGIWCKLHADANAYREGGAAKKPPRRQAPKRTD